jgi:hypothetical protein
MKLKYAIIGSPGQVAATSFSKSLTAAKKFCEQTKFCNGLPALVAHESNTLRDAKFARAKFESSLAFQAGRLGRWLTPTFVIVSRKEIQMREL